MQFINGKTAAGTGPEQLTVLNPATGDVLETYPEASAGDVDAAVNAAAAAFPEWSRATPADRSDALHRAAALLRERSAELADAETRQTGKPIRLSTEFDVPGTIDNFEFFAGAARNLEGKAAGEYVPTHTSQIRREPIGVIGSIAPWNYPLQMAAWKILPAIAAGNTIVVKPAEITPLTTVALAQACLDAGIPEGVVNVVTGAGPSVGEALVTHPGVSMVSFTGSTAVGTRIMGLVAPVAKRVHLELGGKAPMVVFDDADLEGAIRGAVAGALINGGQDCTAATRAYIQRPLFDDFVHGVADVMSSVRIGDTMSMGTDLGSLISLRQRERVDGFVRRAEAEGAKIEVGGTQPAVGWDGTDLSRGAYYAPTLITNVDQRSEIVQHEIFGPVLVVLPFDDDTEGIRLANDTSYGLAASAWTRDLQRGLRASRELQAGTVWINDHISLASEMPHGGVKQSGFGKDMSTYAFDEYTTVKHVMVDITGASRRDWHRTIFTDDGAAKAPR
ncbi:gamma-aminobutyraldehyde dehydrogenase [Kribbella sp. NPDC050124]|uniref:gamma-aminobutyraldehyde dehydrogenase n=1 Tax=Kribbella sp. NPDC050124 TaxID=3364114 RepID=UPI00378B6D10